MKKLVAVLTLSVMTLGLTACGGNDNPIDMESDLIKNIDARATVTAKEYKNFISDTSWEGKTFEEFTKELGVLPVEDTKSTRNMGKDYFVVDYAGPDSDSTLHVVFKKDGKDFKVYSVTPIGNLEVKVDKK